MTREELQKQQRLWERAGIFAGVAVLLVAVFLVFEADDESRATDLGVGGAVAAGFLLVAVGIGLIKGEALMAQRVEVSRLPPGRVEGGGGGPIGEVATGLKEGLAGLTAARALIFAGALLLAVSALGAGLSSASSDGGAATSPAATPSSTPSP